MSRPLRLAFALTIPLSLLAGCGPSRLSDADVTRLCMLQVRCGTLTSQTTCESLVRGARDQASTQSCSGPFGAAGRCVIRTDSCVSTTECADEQARLDACLDGRTSPDAGTRVDARIPMSGTEGAVRQTSGFLEVFHMGEWRGVCDDGFDVNDAAVICRQLGTPTISEPLISASLSGSGAFWVDDLACIGEEFNIAACESSMWGVENCSDGEHVLVTCN